MAGSGSRFGSMFNFASVVKQFRYTFDDGGAQESSHDSMNRARPHRPALPSSGDRRCADARRANQIRRGPTPQDEFAIQPPPTDAGAQANTSGRRRASLNRRKPAPLQSRRRSRLDLGAIGARSPLGYTFIVPIRAPSFHVRSLAPGVRSRGAVEQQGGEGSAAWDSVGTSHAGKLSAVARSAGGELPPPGAAPPVTDGVRAHRAGSRARMTWPTSSGPAAAW